jgi:hypothetical protein
MWATFIRYLVQFAPKLIGLLPLALEVGLRLWNSLLKKKQKEEKEKKNG